MELLDIVIILVIGGVIIAWTCWSGVFRRRHREQFRHDGLSPKQKEYIEKIALCRRLPPALKEELYGKTAIFLREKEFEGLEGLKITTEISTTVAALACLLILKRDVDYYPKMRTVLLTPRAYYSDHRTVIGGQLIEEENVGKLGESWSDGTLRLSWADALADAHREHGHRNVVLHEFAHQLDQLDGVANGVPPLDRKEDYVTWKKVMSEEMEKLRHEVKHHDYHTIDEYGITNNAEFFAVVTEGFFCNPVVTRDTHPAMYELLVNFYKQDPAQWDIHNS